MGRHGDEVGGVEDAGGEVGAQREAAWSVMKCRSRGYGHERDEARGRHGEVGLETRPHAVSLQQEGVVRCGLGGQDWNAGQSRYVDAGSCRGVGHDVTKSCVGVVGRRRHHLVATFVHLAAIR